MVPVAMVRATEAMRASIIHWLDSGLGVEQPESHLEIACLETGG